MTTYSYDINDDFTNGLAKRRLHKEIVKSNITTTFDGINRILTSCEILFDSDLTATEKDTLDSIVGNHSGDTLPDWRFRASSKIAEMKTDIPSGTYSELGGTVTNPATIIGDLTKAMGTVTGCAQADDGDTIKIRAKEVAKDGTENVLSHEHEVTGTGTDSWVSFDFSFTHDLTNSRNIYLLEAKLETASYGSAKYVEMSLFENII